MKNSSELGFWEKRVQNLAYIQWQLRTERAKKVFQILSLSGSTYATAIRKVEAELAIGAAFIVSLLFVCCARSPLLLCPFLMLCFH